MPSSPSGPPERAFLTRLPYAHRGLHGAGVIENSRAAFLAAIDARCGIELDVQVSRDGSAFVFHDHDLDRLTGEAGGLAERDGAAVDRIRIAGSDETIPRLSAILALIGTRAPLLIEIKVGAAAPDALCAAVARDLAQFTGEAAIMSFSPEVSRWFAIHQPERARGLVISERDKGGFRGAAERRLSLIVGRPHFLAYDVRDLPSGFARAHRARGMPILSWTVRNATQAAIAAAHADQPIFEGTRPGVPA